MVNYLIALTVLIISSMASAEYMMHMQCCKVVQMQHLIVAEYAVALSLNKRSFNAALHAICFKYNCMINIDITILKR